MPPSGELYIGLMSGTSIDSIDAVLLDLQGDSQTLIAHLSMPWPPDLQEKIRALTTPGSNELERLGELEHRVADQFAAAAQNLIHIAKIDPDQIRAIGSHGQTIRHYPDTTCPSTLQIGDPNRITEKTGITVVADFRRRDMAAGGQGAPLVPAYHAALLGSPDEYRVILNLGGIANITCLPGGDHSRIIGFDTGPANTLLDAWIRKNRQLEMDRNGEWAASGKADRELLGRLLADPYFHKEPPKSTGPEHFNLSWLESHLDQERPLEPANIQATLASLTCESVSDSIERYANGCQRVIVCGGGAYNAHLLDLLGNRLPGMPIETMSVHGMEPNQVEAAAFAWLAYRTLNRLPGNLPAVTGASHPVILGGIYPACK
jgi:anhydro-N-acetylmuramic acid kinase